MNTYDTLASSEAVEIASKALAEHGFKPERLATKEAALKRIIELIPAGASVMNGSSTTLKQIGYIELLKSGKHPWNDLHREILAEQNPEKQGALRRESVLSNYYLGSVHAVSQTGELVIASNTGSQLPHLAFTSPNSILVVSTMKITQDLPSALERLREHVFPLEDQRMKDEGMGGSAISKILILQREQAFLGRNVHILFVDEKLGF